MGSRGGIFPLPHDASDVRCIRRPLQGAQERTNTPRTNPGQKALCEYSLPAFLNDLLRVAQTRTAKVHRDGYLQRASFKRWRKQYRTTRAKMSAVAHQHFYFRLKHSLFAWKVALSKTRRRWEHLVDQAQPKSRNITYRCISSPSVMWCRLLLNLAQMDLATLARIRANLQKRKTCGSAGR